MLRNLLRGFVLALLAVVDAPTVHAQVTSPEEEKSERSAPALPYAVMALFTLFVLTVVCMPSRKA